MKDKDFDSFVEYVESLEQQNQLLMQALKYAGKWMRQYPPSVFPEEVPFEMFINAEERDPEGTEWIAFWLNQVV